MNDLERTTRLNELGRQFGETSKIPGPVREALLTLVLYLFEFLYKYFMERAGQRKSLASMARGLFSKEFREDLGKLDGKLNEVIREL